MVIATMLQSDLCPQALQQWRAKEKKEKKFFYFVFFFSFLFFLLELLQGQFIT
jgi:hypothetical protein